MILSNVEARLQPGHLVVFKYGVFPIVHRLVHVRTSTDRETYVTKGDYNSVDDRGLYRHPRKYLDRQEIVGRVVGVLRIVGVLANVVRNYPFLWHVMRFRLAWWVLLPKSQTVIHKAIY